MSAHTPGPWAVGGDDGLIWVTPPDTRQNVICDLQPRDADSFTEEDEANARLIAAAPDLLLAIKLLYRATDHYDPEPSKLGALLAAIEATKAAVAKAEGK